VRMRGPVGLARQDLRYRSPSPSPPAAPSPPGRTRNHIISPAPFLAGSEAVHSEPRLSTASHAAGEERRGRDDGDSAVRPAGWELPAVKADGLAVGVDPAWPAQQSTHAHLE